MAKNTQHTVTDPRPAVSPTPVPQGGTGTPQANVATDNGQNPPRESKEEKFRRLIGPRVSKALAAMINVERLGNKNQYSYTEEEKGKVIAALERGLESVRRAFNGGAKKGTLFSL